MKKPSTPSAFSLIELSMVITIIAIIIAAVVSSSTLLTKFRLSSARTLTLSSPILGIADNAMWLETSLAKSFKESEEQDESAITLWNDIRESTIKRNATSVDSNNTPIFSNSINRVQQLSLTAVKLNILTLMLLS